MPHMPHIDKFSENQIEQIESCPYCKSDKSLPMFVENGFPYVQCESCTLIYLQRRVREEHLGLVYADDYHAEAPVDWLRHVAEGRLALFSTIPSGGRIHEDGAGAGAFVALCNQRGYQCSGNDVGNGAVEQAHKLFKTEILQGPLHSVEIQSSSLDGFASFNLLSHLYQPWQYLKDVNRLLRVGGKLLLRTGDRRGNFRNLRWGTWSAPEHTFHYTRHLLRDMLTSSGFEVNKIVPAFDSDYPYFLYDYSRIQDASLKRRVTMLLCGGVIYGWNLLGLPKDDVFVIANKVASAS